MNSDSNNNITELPGTLLSFVTIGLLTLLLLFLTGSSNESNNEEKGAGTTSNNTDTNTLTICAACGKEGDGDSMNACNKCDLVQYCNAACKKKHRSRHKKKCEKRAAELYDYDEELFQEPPPREECPICMLPPPLYDNHTGMTFKSCCGKDICNGCIHAMRETGDKNMKLCPFCKTMPPRSPEEEVKRVMKLTEKGNAYAFNHLAGCYERGILGLPQDMARANELLLKAGELGCAAAYFNLGVVYTQGRGVEVDKKKAKHYYELAAINGSLHARHNLGCAESRAGNYQRAFKHFTLAASAGYEKSLDGVKGGFMDGHVTKEEYESTLREYQKSQDEMKSDARGKALAARNERMDS
jgi:TPR repeat protein